MRKIVGSISSTVSISVAVVSSGGLIGIGLSCFGIKVPHNYNIVRTDKVIQLHRFVCSTVEKFQFIARRFFWSVDLNNA